MNETDCIELMRSLPSNSVQVAFADPPFNLNKKYANYKDNLDFEDYFSWTKEWLSEASRVIRDDGSLFVYNIPKLLTYTAGLLNETMEFRHWIAWNSIGRPLGKTLQPAHYGILFYTKSRSSKFYDVRAPHARCRKCQSYLRDYGGKEHLRHPFGYQVSGVWSDIHRTRHKICRIQGHPCQLPVHLIERMILMTTDETDVVLDLFSGGGTAGIAAKQLGRRFIGCEIDKGYCQAANQRIQESQKVKGENGAYVSVHLGNIVSVRAIDI